MHEHDLAGLRQRHGPAAARALDQPLPRDPLERGDLPADRRLHEAELLGRAPKRPFAGDSVERRQMPNLDPEPMIGLHDSSGTIVHRTVTLPPSMRARPKKDTAAPGFPAVRAADKA